MKISSSAALVLLAVPTSSGFWVVVPHQKQTGQYAPMMIRPTTTTLLESKSNSKSTTTTTTTLPDFGKTPVNVDQIRLETKAKWRREDLFGNSLIDQTMEEIEVDEDFQNTARRLEEVGAEAMSKEERTQRRRALTKLGVPSFAKFLAQELNNGSSDSSSSSSSSSKVYQLQRKAPAILQINIGLYCNQACGHCHVESSPLRTEEMMTSETAAQCLELLRTTPSITTLDITGGAPELNANFRYLVSMAREIRPDLQIIDRCNLTVLQEPGQEDLVDFLKNHNVHIIASLPCYSESNVDTQRGKGVFERSIAALLALNDAGYGNVNNNANELQLDLVYNPLGAFLPPEQSKLEIQYKKQLDENFGILFNQLFTITNMPIKRFADFLHRRDELKEYMDLLVRNFNPDTVPSLMCLDTVSVGWDGKVRTVFVVYEGVFSFARISSYDGYTAIDDGCKNFIAFVLPDHTHDTHVAFKIYDCDFNQQLGYNIPGVKGRTKEGLSVFDIETLNELVEKPIRTDNHCFGCTAGMGSS